VQALLVNTRFSTLTVQQASLLEVRFSRHPGQCCAVL
jgi:hypothetical protein